ncbi:probable enoyl-CoA hydratase 2, mitochondrial isoform X1 [Cucurbita moschata]|uniref:Probable enoyl-CoA hydratase 2, mitochondrial isoform X1 n=1 Tax=Cucurbita moschata TaxID=3662 RepID=A0A6J1GH00_CUCMO|nr:probable enoyl-CoA hydratase 2, mitochondrial isoform X1 [Cucurbita moschata]
MGAFRVLSRKLINLTHHSPQNLPIPAKRLAHPFPASNFSYGFKSFSHPWQYSHCRTLILESVSSEPVRLHRLSDSDSGIVEVHLDRPEAKNAISKEMLRGLRHAFESVDCDPSVNVMMIRSTVPKVFCAGADLKERKNMTASEVQSFVTSLRSAFSFLEALRIPTISVIEGAALGGGLEMALACDLRICGEDAKLSLPETGLAIIPGMYEEITRAECVFCRAGGTARLPRLVGKSIAKELIFTGRKVSGRDAISIGLVNYCVPAGGAYVKALEIAQEINQKGPLAIKMAKKAIDEGLEVGLESAMEVEEECYKELLNTVDRLEGLAAFAEKRKPRYRGE